MSWSPWTVGSMCLKSWWGCTITCTKMDRSIVGSCICAKNTCTTGCCSRASTSEDSSIDDASFHFTRPKVRRWGRQKLQGLAGDQGKKLKRYPWQTVMKIWKLWKNWKSLLKSHRSLIWRPTRTRTTGRQSLSEHQVCSHQVTTSWHMER